MNIIFNLYFRNRKIISNLIEKGIFFQKSFYFKTLLFQVLAASGNLFLVMVSGFGPDTDSDWDSGSFRGWTVANLPSLRVISKLCECCSCTFGAYFAIPMGATH